MSAEKTVMREIRLNREAIHSVLRAGVEAPETAAVQIRSDDGIVQEAVIRWNVEK